jgi:glycerophosphoryl diester phosphodiesterase
LTHPTTPAWTGPRWIAHRGAGKLAPENTLAAFRLGASLGWRAYECDVKLSADGVPFLLHDATLARTLGSGVALEPALAGDTVAGSLPWSRLARLDAGAWHGRLYAGEAPPTLEAIARWCLANRLALNVEIKPTPGDEARTGAVVATAVQRLWADAVAGGDAAWPLLSSFQPESLAAALQAAPELPRALLLDSLWDDCLGVAERLGCGAVVLNHQLVDGPRAIDDLHARGMQALVYTVNDADRAATLQAWGIDAVITDAVDRFVPD